MGIMHQVQDTKSFRSMIAGERNWEVLSKLCSDHNSKDFFSKCSLRCRACGLHLLIRASIAYAIQNCFELSFDFVSYASLNAATDDITRRAYCIFTENKRYFSFRNPRPKTVTAPMGKA
jgi:hypothetical protein